MNKNREQKQQEIDRIKEKVRNSYSMVVVGYSGITVSEITELRARFRKAGVDYAVLKNTLVRRAMDELGINDFDHLLEGPNAYAFGMKDLAAPAKLITEFIDQAKNDKLKIKAGLAEGQFLDLEGVKALAKLPSREALIARLMSSMNAPASNLVGVLSATLRSLANALEAVRKQKAGE